MPLSRKHIPPMPIPNEMTSFSRSASYSEVFKFEDFEIKAHFGWVSLFIQSKLAFVRRQHGHNSCELCIDEDAHLHPIFNAFRRLNSVRMQRCSFVSNQVFSSWKHSLRLRWHGWYTEDIQGHTCKSRKSISLLQPPSSNVDFVTVADAFDSRFIDVLLQFVRGHQVVAIVHPCHEFCSMSLFGDNESSWCNRHIAIALPELLHCFLCIHDPFRLPALFKVSPFLGRIENHGGDIYWRSVGSIPVFLKLYSSGINRELHVLVVGVLYDSLFVLFEQIVEHWKHSVNCSLTTLAELRGIVERLQEQPDVLQRFSVMGG